MIGEDFVGKEEVLKILNKDSSALTEAERAILEARSSYLTKEEKERYGIGIEGGLSSLSLKALKKEAKTRGVDITGLKEKEEIIEAIESSGEEEEEEEEE